MFALFHLLLAYGLSSSKIHIKTGEICLQKFVKIKKNFIFSKEIHLQTQRYSKSLLDSINYGFI